MKARHYPLILLVITSPLLACSAFYQELSDSKAESRRTAISVPENVVAELIQRTQIESVSRMEPLLQPENISPIAIEDFDAFSIHRGAINALLVSAAGNHAFTGGVDGQVRSNTLQHTLSGLALESKQILNGKKPILALAISPDQKYLAVAQWSLVTLFDLENRVIVSQLSQVRGRITALAWDPHGELLVLGRANGDIFVWNIGSNVAQADRSKDSLEIYLGGSSPITALLFHPLGRTFISAEQSGSVNIWRLLRTETELQLRGNDLASEQTVKKVLKSSVASIDARVEDLWLDAEGSHLYAAASNGNIYGRKMRGLLQEAPIVTGDEGLLSLTGVSMPWNISPSPALAPPGNLLVSSGRQHRIRFWCKYAAIKLGAKAGLDGISRTDIPLAQSQSFQEPLTRLRVASKSQTLWAVQKTGKLIVFDAKKLFKAPGWEQQVRRCEQITDLSK